MVRKDLTVSEEEIEALCRTMKEVALANCKNDRQKSDVKDVTKNVLISWGILAEEDGNIYPTNAYVFLLGKNSFLSRIQCGVFKGSNRTVFVDKREYSGALWEQVEEAYQFVLRNIHLGAQIEGIYRKDIYEIPPESIRELIINAAVHCSFLQSSVIQVAVFDDRLEITSPGGLLPGVTLEKMREGYSKVRNRAIASAFSYMNIIEQWGSGIPRLMEEVSEYGLKEPEFIDMESALRINIYRNPGQNVTMEQDDFEKTLDFATDFSMKESLEVGQIKTADVSKRKTLEQYDIILDFMKDRQWHRTAEMAEILGLKSTRTKELLKELTAMDKIMDNGKTKGKLYKLK
jgi:predicted HTH transcriptional regulator